MIVEIILGLVAITLGWTTFNLTRKVERLESWVEDYAQRVIRTQQTLKEMMLSKDMKLMKSPLSQ